MKLHFDNHDRPLAVVITRTSWNEPPRIRHQLTRQLERFYNVLYVEKLSLFENKLKESVFDRISDRIIICRPYNPTPVPLRIYANIPYFHIKHNIAFSRKLNQIVRSFSCKIHILINFLYDFPEIMIDPFYDYKLYVCYDEFPRMRRKEKDRFKVKSFYQAVLFQHYENQVAKKADICLTISKPLFEKLEKVNTNTISFYPGHEFEINESVSINKKKTKNIKVAFMGYITYNLFYHWLELLTIQSYISLYMIGPLHKLNYERLLKLIPKVNYIPPLTGQSLKNKLDDMDVLIMPYNTNIPEVKAVTVPNKLFQYIAAAKPIVISDMPNFIQMQRGILYRASTAEEFVEKVEQAYHEDCQEYVDLRLKIAAENTWDERGNLLRNIIDNGIS